MGSELLSTAGPVITIDGPAGAGKSTIAKKLAERLGFIYIDTGAMYRAITLFAMQNKVDFADQKGLSNLALHAKIVLDKGPENRVYLNGKDITNEIRDPKVSEGVSQVASHGELRQIMVAQQRQMARSGRIVMDGRDIGSVVLPDADLKIFLTADLEVRAKRRYEELIKEGHNTTLNEVKQSLKKRDWLDLNRDISPLQHPIGAVTIDTSNKSIDQVVEEIIELIK